MAYKFKLDERIQAGLRRIAVEQIDRAVATLESTDTEPKDGTAVHVARKSIKRLRALLRLVRPALGEPVFTRENAELRDTAAVLSHARDTQILLETVARLDAHYAEAPHAGLKKLHHAIAARHIENDRSAESEARLEAVARLGRARNRFTRLKLDPDGFDAVRMGLEQSFRRGRKAFDHAYAEPSDETFHEWRKGVQQHWRHMALLSRAWPAMAEARVAAARRLSDILGDDHDLTVLQQRLEALAPPSLSARDRRAILKLAATRQDELRTLARPIGERLFADGARDFSRRVALYWSAAQTIRETRQANAGADGDAG